MLSGKLLNIPVKVLRADLMKSSLVCPFKRSPEGFDPVSMSHTLNGLPNTVINRFVIRKPAAALMVISIDLSVRGSVVFDKALYCFLFPVGYSPGDNLVRLPVLYSHHKIFAGRSLYMAFLIIMLVSVLTAHKGFIRFDRALKIVVPFKLPSFPYFVKHGPGRGLGYPYVPVKFHTGNTLEAGKAKVNSQRPLLEGDIRTGYGGSGTDTEIASAATAPVRHRFSVGNFACFRVSTLGAKAGITPDNRLKPVSGRFLVRKHFHKFQQGDSFSVGFARACECYFIFHGDKYTQGNYFVK